MKILKHTIRPFISNGTFLDDISCVFAVINDFFNTFLYIIIATNVMALSNY